MIEVRALMKRYGDTVAVDGLGFEVRPGAVTGFIGPNGSGKSTTMRMIMGLDRPDTGTARVNGRRYQELSRPLREVGALLEARTYHPGRSARNHLTALAAGNGIPRSRVDAVLATVGLTDVARKRAGGFTLGMSQRLGIAAALLGDPAVLLFDEPVNGLDPEGVRWIRTLMKSLAAEGRTVLLSSHLISEMALTADHLIVIGRGRLLADTSVGELTANGRSLEDQARPTELRGREPEGAGRSAVSGGLNARSGYRISTTSVLVWTCQSSAARLCRATLRALSENSAVPPPPRWNDEGQSP